MWKASTENAQKLYRKFLECGGRVATDSRAICGGEMFFALRGENFDGNNYAMQALGKGAAFAVVNSDADFLPQDDRLIRVDDPLKALSDLAAYHRNHVLEGRKLPVIGLTGTNGKTTTKELITAVLGTRFNVTSTKGNLNNDIGVPLSLLSITPQTQIAVIEMGASHPDDIAKLVKVSQPDYGLITNVGRAHLLGFGSFEGVKKAKGELYRYLGAHEGSVIFLNEDDADLKEMARSGSCHCYGYGIGYQNATILPSSPSEPFLRIKLNSEIIRTSLVGAYNAANVLAAICIGDYFGVPRKDAIAAIGEYKPTNNRSQLSRTERNTLIVDAYNANPSSMAAALDNFALVEDSLKIALLGDMRELGNDSLKEHRGCVKKILGMISEGSLQKAYLVGDEFGKALEGANPVDSVLHFKDSVSLAAHLQENVISGAILLVKGSRGIQMEKTLPYL